MCYLLWREPLNILDLMKFEAKGTAHAEQRWDALGTGSSTVWVLVIASLNGSIFLLEL